MHTFKSALLKFGSKGEKTGWTYVPIPSDLIKKLKLKDRKGFRIKGLIDDIRFEKLSTYPIGDGEYVIAINTELRKKIQKKHGAMVIVKFGLDKAKPLQSRELLDCLKDDEEAMRQFKTQLLSHQNYFHRYVETAKGQATKAGRIVNVITAMHRKQNFGEMVRNLKKQQ